MELLLNLAWLLLALPACWLWKRSMTTRAQGSPSSLQCLLALACLLVLLFPVVSATDDLHAMRAVMEESSPGKRGVRQAVTEKASAGLHWQNPPALIATAALPAIEIEGWQKLVAMPLSVPVTPSTLRASRAPPCFVLG